MAAEIQITNTLFNTKPAVIHAHGSHRHIPNWQPIREAFFASRQLNFGPCNDLTIITCNNGHEAMGIAEKSMEHLGIPYKVFGQGVENWINSRDKPRVLFEALKTIETEYVLYVDSRDAIIIANPQIILKRFKSAFDCDLLFSGDRINWPNDKDFLEFEKSVNSVPNSDFCFLNGGLWMGRTNFCTGFFEEACNTEPVPSAADSEQGILKKLFPKYHPRVQLDYRCEIFQNIGFVLKNIFEIAT